MGYNDESERCRTQKVKFREKKKNKRSSLNLGKYKHGKPNREISIKEFVEFLDKGEFDKPSHKAFFVLIFWIGCRRSEPLKMIKEDIRESEGSLFVKIPAFKRGERGGEIELPLDFPGMEFIKKRWLKTNKKRRLFPFSTSTSWRIVKRIDNKLSPHWFRHNRITKLRKLKDQGKISQDDIKSWTGLKRDATIEGYGMTTQQGIHKISKVLNVDLTE